MEKPDYYEVLGVSRDSDERTIKKAYRKLAMQYHPDRNPGDSEAEDQFKMASEAYEVLRDQEKRQLYDTYGHAGLNNQGFHGFSGVDDIFSQFADIFGDFLGGRGGGRRGGAARGGDVRYDLELDFLEAAFGTKKSLTIPRHVRCSRCEGAGAEPGTERRRCDHCGGRGQIHHQQGFFTLATTCPTCRGKGEVIPNPCTTCKGAGVEQEEREVTVRIPAGVDTGNRLRLRAEGELGARGGPPGDLYVFIAVHPHAEFERNGADIHLLREISFVQAALGTKMQVPTLEGETELTVSPGTQPSDTVVLRGEGIPKVNGRGRGNLIIHLKVVIPTKLDAEARAHLTAYAGHEELAVLDATGKLIPSDDETEAESEGAEAAG